MTEGRNAVVRVSISVAALLQELQGTNLIAAWITMISPEV